MKNIENLPEEIFDLLTNKSYDQLSNQEKTLVVTHLSAAEYNNFRGIVSDFQILDNRMNVSAENNSFTEKPESMIRRIMDYKIPLYQAASVLLFFVIFTYAFAANDPFNSVNENKRPTPNTALTDKNSSPIIEEGKMEDSQNLKDVVQVRMDTLGKSLAKEKYPRGLIFNL